MRLIVLCFVIVMCVTTSKSVLAEDAVRRAVTSANGDFEVTLESRVAPVPIARFHEWTATVVGRDGQPVHPARLRVGGGMEGHGHGMPSQPQVTRYLGEGVWLIEGMKFNMAGAWTIVIAVDSETFSYQARVPVNVDH